MSVDPKKFGITSSLIETVKEALKGSQHKIDVAEPKGKITGADFKKLRGEGSYMVGPPVKPEAPLDTVNRVASDLKKMASEPIKPMGSKTSSTTSLPKATFNLKPPMGEGAKPDFLDLDKDGNKKEPMKHAAKHAKEEVEQVDELSDKTIQSYREKSHRDPKPREKGRAMAFAKQTGIGAKIKATKEEVEQVDEISDTTLKSYRTKAMQHSMGHQPGDSAEVKADRNRKTRNRSQGVRTSYNKMIGRYVKVGGSGKKTYEEVEQVDEISDKVKHSYIKKAEKQADKSASVLFNPNNKYTGKDKYAAHDVRYHKRLSGIEKAKSSMKEDAEQVDEISDKVKQSYIKKAGKQADKSASVLFNPNNKYTGKDKYAANDVRYHKRLAGIEKAKSSMKEDAEVEMTEAESHAAKQIAARKDAMKTHLQNKIAKKQMSAMQAKANQRLKNINASNDKCSCGDTNESKMKCEMHGGKDAKMGREKIEVNPPLREAEDLPKKVVTKGHEIAKSLIKNKASVREPYAVGMAQAKKSAGIKN